MGSGGHVFVTLRCAAPCLLAGVLVLLGGCASKPEDEAKTAYYRCGESARFGVKPLNNDRIELVRSPNRYTLKRVEAASGVKYASDKASFWNQGDEALIEVGDKRWSGCTFDSVQADPESIGRLQQIFFQTGGGSAR